jgi:hypothetical protein
LDQDCNISIEGAIAFELAARINSEFTSPYCDLGVSIICCLGD